MVTQMPFDSRVAVLERDSQIYTKTFEKNEELLEKLGEILVNVEKMLSAHDVRIEHLDEQVERNYNEQHEQYLLIDKRLSLLEKWKWIVIGGAVILGDVLANIFHLHFLTSPSLPK